MKAKTWLVFMILFTAVIYMRGVEVKAETESLERWDLTQEYTLTKDDVKYYAYLTKDGKESWIYKIEVLDKQKMLDIVFPDEVRGVSVSCLGYTSTLYEKLHSIRFLDAHINFLGDLMEPWHGGGKPTKNIRSIVLPDSAQVLAASSLAEMEDLQYVHLPGHLTELRNGMFFHDRKIEKIDFPSKVKLKYSDYIFVSCKKLAGLQHENNRLANDTLIYSGNMVINQTEKTLIQVMPDAKKITIPADLKWIEPTAFKYSSLKSVKVSKKNKNFAVNKKCLYRKKEGELVLIFGKGSKVTLSKKIREIGEDVATTKYKIKKLIIPKKIKRYDNWKKPFISNNKKIKIYYRGKRIR